MALFPFYMHLSFVGHFLVSEGHFNFTPSLDPSQENYSGYLFIHCVPCLYFKAGPIFIVWVYSLGHKKFRVKIWHVNLNVIFLLFVTKTLVKMISRKRQPLWVLMWKVFVKSIQVYETPWLITDIINHRVTWLIFWALQ